MRTYSGYSAAMEERPAESISYTALEPGVL